jgi:aryl-alcohol dehydrogenase-like predicted oxidoreductase
MKYRTFGRTGWRVSSVGYGMWGLGGWTGTDEEAARQALQLAVDLGCNFFDTALAYGEGKSERMLGELVRANRDRKLYVASKIPPMNRRWPSRRGDQLGEVFPADYLRAATETSLKHLGLPQIDLMQFHVWEDSWAADERWRRAMETLKREGLIRAIGVSVNRWEPENVLETLKTGVIDAVQVIYNIFDQAPEDRLFPICRDLGVAVIARVPFDEGSLTGALTKDSKWPEGDWRNLYFVPENLYPTIERVEKLKPLVPPDSTLPALALRFILANPDVATVIPGMRSPVHVRANLATSAAAPLPAELLAELRRQRWDRQPSSWSQ